MTRERGRLPGVSLVPGSFGLGDGGIGVALSTGGGWSPIDLGASLVAWWSADRADLLTLSGSQVTSWRDVKGGYNLAQALSAARPLYSATGWAGAAPGITFDGVDDELTCTDAGFLGVLPTGAGPGNIFALFDQTRPATTVSDTVIAGYGSAQSTGRRLYRGVVSGQNTFYVLVGNGGGVAAPGVIGVDFTGRHAAQLRVDATTVTPLLDGTVGAVASTVATTDTTRFRYGAAPTASAAAFSQGTGRDLILTGALTTDQETQLRTYLATRRMP